MKTVALNLFVFAFVISGLGQSLSRTLKFDEFEVSPPRYFYYDSGDITNMQRIDRLVRQLKQLRGVKVYIVSYKARQSMAEGNYTLQNVASEAKSKAIFEAKVPDGNVIEIDGGFREADMIEFWVGSNKSGAPMATATISKDESYACPTVYVSTEGRNFDVAKPVTFSAMVRPGSETGYNWTVSTGRITEGQGTAAITVDLAGSKRITVFVEVSGLPQPCNRVAFTTTDIGPRPFLVDSADRFNYSDLSARVDNFMTQVFANSLERGYIITYRGRVNDKWEYNIALQSVKKIFAFRKYAFDRVTLVDGGYREHNSVDFWLIPPGVEPPLPHPTADDIFIPRTRGKRTGRSAL